MEDSTPKNDKKEMTNSIEIQTKSLINNNDDIEKVNKINDEFIKIIDNINKDFDFINFNKENLLTKEKVIYNYIIIHIYIVFYRIKIYFIRKRKFINRFI